MTAAIRKTRPRGASLPSARALPALPALPIVSPLLAHGAAARARDDAFVASAPSSAPPPDTRRASFTGCGVRSPLAMRAERGSPQAQRMRRAIEALVRGESPTLGWDDVLPLQAMALTTTSQEFRDRYGLDSDLLVAVEGKQPHFRTHDDQALRAIVFGGDTHTRQRDALVVLLRTFANRDASDDELRRAVLQKLGDIGTRFDVRAVLPVVRIGSASDLAQGLSAVWAITARHGSSQERGDIAVDTLIAPILDDPNRSDDEARAAIEEVLRRGLLKSTRRFQGSNLTEVHFITFHETIVGKDGRRRPVRGVWKPERATDATARYFTREIACAELDKKHLRSGRVPPTVEGVLSLYGEAGCRVGSLQFLVEDAVPLGVDVTTFDPRFDALRETEAYKVQEAQVRALTYIFSDPDKLGNNIIHTHNLQNLLVDRSEKLWMIDNAYTLGAPWGELDEEQLPEKLDEALTSRLRDLSPERAASIAKRWIQLEHVGRLQQRLARAQALLAPSVDARAG